MKPISRGYLRSLRLTTLSALILTSFIQLANGQNSREIAAMPLEHHKAPSRRRKAHSPIPHREQVRDQARLDSRFPAPSTTRRPPAICCSTTSTINRSAASSMSPIPKTASRPNPAPITFLYNGGPGSASMWLHMGSVGPVRVVTASPQGHRPGSVQCGSESVQPDRQRPTLSSSMRRSPASRAS